MNILVVGNIDQTEEFKAKFGNQHRYISVEDSSGLESHQPEVIFDFVAEDDPDSLENYENLDCPVFFSNTKSSLALLNLFYPIRENWYGFNGIPSFVNRPLLEITISDKDHTIEIEKICHKLQTDYVIVDDRVGMVTPRVICMIINEAFYTLGEGTASKEDIDLAMKLGTNYPFGPFEWSERIGIVNVYEILEAVYDDTKDERYKIAPELKKLYLKQID